ncbi:hypothetical protein N752_10895 [Desulforamulus aquiferis]|nr:hypothetical protein [Desulforamulus aquiferis]RYD05071.1 hypothetical protein N752_10895 [Desulforamulus aquiferis]
MHFKKTNILLLIIICLLVLSGCARQESPKQVKKGKELEAYFPMEQDLTWQYEGEGNEYASFTRRVMYQEGDRLQIAEDNGGTKVALVYQVGDNEIAKLYSEPEFYTDENILQGPPNMHEVILKGPLEVGTTWQNERFKREIISVNEEVKVPAGNYGQVVKVKITSMELEASGSEQYEYYAENVGLIMREFIIDQEKIVSRLKSMTKTKPLAQIKQATISIEGIPQEFTLNLLDGSPLPFYTYFPSDMVDDRVSSGEGDTFRIMANFSGTKREDALMSIFFYPEGTSTEDAVKFANSLIINNRWEKVNYSEGNTIKQYPWSESEWPFLSQTNNISYLGNIVIGKHRDRVFQVMLYYPEEFSEGFIPRVNKIIDEFTWTDTKTKLTED